MRKVPFVSGEYYHVYSRTILSIPEFQDNKNVERLTQSFLIANSTKSTAAFQFLRDWSEESLEKIKDIIID